jgi:hypothetical protein
MEVAAKRSEFGPVLFFFLHAAPSFPVAALQSFLYRPSRGPTSSHSTLPIKLTINSRIRYSSILDLLMESLEIPK